MNAFAYFKKRELMSKKAPKKKVTKEDEEKKYDMTSIRLDGESDGRSLFLILVMRCVGRSGHTSLSHPSHNLGSCDATAQNPAEGKKLESKSLNDILSKRGAHAGNMSGVFYAAYVFFEKKRLKEGKLKSKHREEMEKIYGKSGFDIERGSHQNTTPVLLGHTLILISRGVLQFADSVSSAGV